MYFEKALRCIKYDATPCVNCSMANIEYCRNECQHRDDKFFWEISGKVKMDLMENSPEKGIKYDESKVDWNLLPLDVIQDVGLVFMHGAKKYSPDNWKHVEPKERYFAATLRHLTAHQSGEYIDNDSGLPHIHHAIASLLILAKRIKMEEEGS